MQVAICNNPSSGLSRRRLAKAAVFGGHLDVAMFLKPAAFSRSCGQLFSLRAGGLGNTSPGLRGSFRRRSLLRSIGMNGNKKWSGVPCFDILILRSILIISQVTTYYHVRMWHIRVLSRAIGDYSLLIFYRILLNE